MKSITVFGVRTGEDHPRCTTVSPSPQHASGVVADLIKACTGEDAIWLNPPDEVWVLAGMCLSTKAKPWLSGIRVHPPIKLRYR